MSSRKLEGREGRRRASPTDRSRRTKMSQGRGRPRFQSRESSPRVARLLHYADLDAPGTELRRSEKLVALGELVAVVAHELGNPLSIISSSLQYLHERLVATNEPAADFTMTALQNVDRMHGMLRGMLDFAAVRRQEPQEIDINRTLSDVIRFMSAECAKRAVEVEASLEPMLPRVCADPSGITQICLNVIKNAFDALAESGGRIAVRTRADAQGTRVVVEIENDGPPIPDHAMAHLFRPFNTTKPSGTGLGLYISRQIAREHGGNLAATNLPGGVMFSLTLPVRSF